MSKDIKVGDWVRIKPGHVDQDNVEFQVTRVIRSAPSTWGNSYAEGDPERNGIWFRFLDKIEKYDIEVGDWVKVNEGLTRAAGEVFQVTEVVPSGATFFVKGEKAGGGVWRRFLDKIDAPTEPKRTSGEIVRSLRPGQKFKVDASSTIYYVREEDGWSVSHNPKYVYPDLSDEFWETFDITVLDDPETSIVEDIAIGVAFEKIIAYRKELIAVLDTSTPDARPIVQAKLTAVNEVIARIQ